jgi:hypothetical protein
MRAHWVVSPKTGRLINLYYDVLADTESCCGPRPRGTPTGEEHMVHLSDRGFTLLWTQAPKEVPVLTVEIYLKWYGLYLIHPDGKVTSVSYRELEEVCRPGERACDDHDPHPGVVARWAAAKGYHLDDRAFELMVGRWFLRVREEEFE